MANLTLEVFNATASTYDIDRSKLIPGCDTFYNWALDLIPARAKVICELGAGSGLMTRLLRDRFPAAHLHVVDFSAPMLDLARSRLGNDPNITWHQSDYAADPLPQNLCAVVSSLSIHHLDDADKRTVFKKVYTSLKPNGVFVNADQDCGCRPHAHPRGTLQSSLASTGPRRRAAEQYAAESLYSTAVTGGLAAPRSKTNCDRLREAGFPDADWLAQGQPFAVLAGASPITLCIAGGLQTV